MEPESQEDPAESAARTLHRCARVLEAQARELEEAGPNGFRTRARRAAFKQILSGILADVEGVRLAIRD